jgi:hypothetical protein
MTLRETIADDYDAVFRNVDDFAEEVQFKRKNLAARSITVIIDEIELPRDTEMSARRVRQIEVEIGRNEQSEKGGVERLEIGDEILRSREHDPLQRPYVWSGEIIESSDEGWVARFTREAHTQTGGQFSNR